MDILKEVLESITLVIDLAGISMILWGFTLSFKDWLMLEVKRGELIGFL